MRKYLTLKQAAALFPSLTHPSTLQRWCTMGLYLRPVKQVIYLEHVYIGRKVVTTKEWLDEFVERVSSYKIAAHRARNKPGRQFLRIMRAVDAEAVLRRAGI